MTRTTGLFVALYATLGAGCSASSGTESAAPGQGGGGVDGVDDAGIPGRDDAAGDGEQSALDGGDSDDCNRIEIAFEPQTPNVFVLVDRSSSMFDQGFWEPLRDGVLTVIDRLDDSVRFGFAAYTGEQGGMCPELTSVDDITLGNAAAISQAYQALGAPAYRGQTPTGAAIAAALERLADAQLEGPNYLLLVTDGEPDFCDDPNPTCSRDAVVAEVQKAYQADVGTFIFSIGGGVTASHLRDVANAGTGQPVSDHDMAVQYQCGTPKASYAQQDGDAPYFEPDVTDQESLVAELGAVVAGVKSCVFDLQGQVEIKLEQAGEGVVELDGTSMPYGDPDGWRMNSVTQLELTGAACARLKQPETRSVLIDFPCEAIVVL